MAFRIEATDEHGNWGIEWAGNASDNVFATEQDAREMLPLILESFGPIFADPDDWRDDYEQEFRLVEVDDEGDPVENGLIRYLNR